MCVVSPEFVVGKQGENHHGEAENCHQFQFPVQSVVSALALGGGDPLLVSEVHGLGCWSVGSKPVWWDPIFLLESGVEVASLNYMVEEW